jgi:hypothetical protein
VSFIKLQFKPGVNRDQTDYSNEGGWRECDKIRFRSGYPEKLGGWLKSAPDPFIGYCRQMLNWVTSYSDDMLAMGTDVKVYIEIAGNYYDITPLRDTDPVLDSPDTDNCINTTNGQAKVTVDLGAVAHGAQTGDYVTISGVTGSGSPSNIGGIPVTEINGNYMVTVVDPFIFTYTVSTSATSTVTGAGGTAIDLAFELSPGFAISVFGYGWGTGTWGRGTWGTGSAYPIALQQRDWWFDNFDNDLVMNFRNGEGYWWTRGLTDDPTNALNTRAISLSAYATTQGFTAASVPVKIMQLLVSQQDRHLIAFGAVPFGSVDPDDFDPMLIRWADQDTPGDWTPSQTNSAGDIRVSRGSRIVRALPTRQEIIVWTDSHLYTLQFLGTTDVFGLQEYADNISIMSPRAMATAANTTYWMGQDKFYAYTGRVETLPCTLRNHVFNDFNLQQADQVICGTNEQWNEVWWFYPTADSDYNNAYVVYNHLERIWYYGYIPRTAWLDTSIRYYPQAANTTGGATSGYLYSHELGVNDDELPMDSYIQSSDFDLDDGDNFMLTRRILPDIGFEGSTAAAPEVTLTVRPRNFPGSAFRVDPADSQRVIETSVGAYTDQVFVRARARQMALKVSSGELGVQWQLGAPRLDARPDGRR